MTSATSAGTTPVVNSDDVQPVVASPVVEVNPPAPESDPAVVADPAVDPAATPDPKATEAEGVQRRINEITAQKYAAQREAKAERDARLAAEAKAEELLSRISKTPATTPDPAAPAVDPKVTEAEIDRRATEKAELLARAKVCNDACNNIVDAGKKEFKDWDATVANLRMVGAIGPDVPADFLETAIELKDPQKILHYLGSNLDEAERIVKSSPKKMAMEMARIEAALNAPVAPAPAPALSNAPAPVAPIAGVAKPGALDINDPNLTTEQFMELRTKQKLEQQSRYRRA